MLSRPSLFRLLRRTLHTSTPRPRPFKPPGEWSAVLSPRHQQLLDQLNKEESNASRADDAAPAKRSFLGWPLFNSDKQTVDPVSPFAPKTIEVHGAIARPVGTAALSGQDPVGKRRKAAGRKGVVRTNEPRTTVSRPTTSATSTNARPSVLRKEYQQLCRQRFAAVTSPAPRPGAVAASIRPGPAPPAPKPASTPYFPSAAQLEREDRAGDFALSQFVRGSSSVELDVSPTVVKPKKPLVKPSVVEVQPKPSPASASAAVEPVPDLAVAPAGEGERPPPSVPAPLIRGAKVAPSTIVGQGRLSKPVESVLPDEAAMGKPESKMVSSPVEQVRKREKEVEAEQPVEVEMSFVQAAATTTPVVTPTPQTSPVPVPALRHFPKPVNATLLESVSPVCKFDIEGGDAHWGDYLARLARLYSNRNTQDLHGNLPWYWSASLQRKYAAATPDERRRIVMRRRQWEERLLVRLREKRFEVFLLVRIRALVVLRTDVKRWTANLESGALPPGVLEEQLQALERRGQALHLSVEEEEAIVNRNAHTLSDLPHLFGDVGDGKIHLIVGSRGEHSVPLSVEQFLATYPERPAVRGGVEVMLAALNWQDEMLDEAWGNASLTAWKTAAKRWV
ncbi:hypothetical protein JCM8097_002466 [Rhodosporidiobolus ruineniae]